MCGFMSSMLLLTPLFESSKSSFPIHIKASIASASSKRENSAACQKRSKRSIVSRHLDCGSAQVSSLTGVRTIHHLLTVSLSLSRNDITPNRHHNIHPELSRAPHMGDDDIDSVISESSEELLKDLLGGITFDGRWEEEKDELSSNKVPGRVDEHLLRHRKSRLSTVTGRTLPVQSSLTARKFNRTADTCNASSTDNSSSAIFDYAFRCSGHCSMDGKMERPPLQVMNLSAEGRGNALVVTAPITRGSVIYTERAAVATQVPPAQIGACQYCFRSLESAEALSQDLPYSQLWPVPLLDFSNEDKSLWTDQCSPHHQVDKFGRIQCKSCKLLFCSTHHAKAFAKEFGGCCLMQQVEDALKAMEEDTVSVQAPVALASRLFCHCLQHFRANHGNLTGHFLEGFCGDATDLNALELGVLGDDERYTLEPLYNQLVSILSISKEEEAKFSVNFFHKVAAQAGRNGFGLLTQSPFKSYYASLLRKSMNRESPDHQENMKQLARALGREKLERGMDRDIEEKVAPEICAVFPLTARCNHSCSPNAQVKSQEFVDAHIDILALRDIQVGEELLISYIPVGTGVGKRSTTQRRRELQAKYLFFCDCNLCSSYS